MIGQKVIKFYVLYSKLKLYSFLHEHVLSLKLLNDFQIICTCLSLMFDIIFMSWSLSWYKDDKNISQKSQPKPLCEITIPIY